MVFFLDSSEVNSNFSTELSDDLVSRLSFFPSLNQASLVLGEINNSDTRPPVSSLWFLKNQQLTSTFFIGDVYFYQIISESSYMIEREVYQCDLFEELFSFLFEEEFDVLQIARGNLEMKSLLKERELLFVPQILKQELNYNVFDCKK